MQRACVLLLPLFLLAGLAACSGDRTAPGTGERRSDLQSLLQRVSADSISSSAHSLEEMVPGDDGDGEIARWVYARLNSFSGNDGRLRVSYDRHPNRGGRGEDSGEELVNVVAVLPGIQMESRDRIYVVCSPYPVAALEASPAQDRGDAAAGTAVLLELTRVISASELDATLVFLALDGREGGAPGAAAFARQVSRRNLNIDAVLSVDLGGTAYERAQGELRVFAGDIPAADERESYYRALLASGGENDTPSRNLARFLHRVAGDHVPGLEAAMVYGDGRRGEDTPHGAFLREGYTAVRLEGKGTGEGGGSGEPSWLEKVTRLKAAALATLAAAPERPRHVRMDRTESGAHLRLRWKPNDEPDLRGYQVVWRRTTAPYWEHETFAGDTTAFVPDDLSSSYYLYGVRAVDRYGNASPAVFPLARN